MSPERPHPDLYSQSLAAALAPADLPSINILIVDDEARNLTVLETVLDDPSYRLVRALSADQALLALLNDEFALLILDVHLPGMSGFELAQTIKSRKKTAQIPIIFLTAHFHDDAHALEGYGTGAVDYLHKPVNAAALRSKVAVFAALYRKGQELALANRTLAAEVVERTRVEEQLRTWSTLMDQRVAALTQSLDGCLALLRAACESAPLALWTWKPADDLLTWENAWAATLFGSSAAALPSSSADLGARLAGPQARERFEEALGRTSRTGERLVFEGALQGEAGSRQIRLEGERIGHAGLVVGLMREA